MDELPRESLFPDPSLDPDSLCEGTILKFPPPGGVPDFLPSTQKALYLRIQLKQQEEEERARRQAEGGRQEREHEEGKWLQEPPAGAKSLQPPLLGSRI